MATRISSTSKRTLHRLTGVAPTVDAMFDVLSPEQLEAVDAELQFPEGWLGVPALLVTGSFEQPVASWCGEINRTTGCEVSRPVNRSAGLLMLAVDGEVYAIGYDQGFRLVPDRVKDRRFGLSFVIRRVDPAQIRDLVAHTPGGGRTDITLVPGGTPVWSLGVQEHAQIVRRPGGRLDGMQLTIGQDNRTKISSVEGGTGLRMRLGVDAADLVADIRAIAGVLRDETPSPALEFVEHIVPVKDDDLVTRLEARLDDLLGEQPDGRIAVAVPSDHWDDYAAAQAFAIKVHSKDAYLTDDFSLEYVLNRVRVQRPGTRFAALRDGTVTLLLAHPGGKGRRHLDLARAAPDRGGGGARRPPVLPAGRAVVRDRQGVSGGDPFAGRPAHHRHALGRPSGLGARGHGADVQRVGARPAARIRLLRP